MAVAVQGHATTDDSVSSTRQTSQGFLAEHSGSPASPIDARRALQIETEYLSGIESNFESAKGKQLRGAIWQTARHDDSDRLRALLASRRMYDRELLKQMPQNRWIALHGYERRWWFGKRATGVAIASVISPLESLIPGSPDPQRPVELGQLVDHVRRLVGDARVPHVVGVCSPTGFTHEARHSNLELPNVTLVLIEPRDGGGWRVSGVSDKLPERVLSMFDPEVNSQKLARVRREIEAHSADLLTGSMSAATIAERLNLPESLVATAFQEMAQSDPELRVSRKDGETLMYRGAPLSRQESFKMSVVERIRHMFTSSGDESRKINLLAERRAALAQRRDRIYEDIGKLERREADLLTEGRSSESAIAKRRLAAQLAQLRKDIARQNTTAAMLNQQINIISTDIHNLTLIQQGQIAQLPDTEELTQNAVKAEEMLETLKANADLIGNLETGMAETSTSDEELEILKEFEQSAPAAVQAEAPSRVARPASPVAEKGDSFRAPSPPARERRPSEPEAS